MFDDLTNRIYEAAFVPDLWPDVLEDIDAVSGSVGGAVFLFGDDQPARGRAIEEVAIKWPRRKASAQRSVRIRSSPSCAAYPSLNMK